MLLRRWAGARGELVEVWLGRCLVHVYATILRSKSMGCCAIA